MLIFVNIAKKNQTGSGLVILISTYSLSENGFSFK